MLVVCAATCLGLCPTQKPPLRVGGTLPTGRQRWLWEELDAQEGNSPEVPAGRKGRLAWPGQCHRFWEEEAKGGGRRDEGALDVTVPTHPDHQATRPQFCGPQLS